MMKKSIHYTDEVVDPDEVDVLLAKELNKLSVNSRTNIDEEIHGVSCLAPKETPELLISSLENLSSELESMPSIQKQGFIQSQELFPDNQYVNGRSFRLMFLRCELFDSKKAALRLARYLDYVLEIFPNNKELLRRPIRLDDIGPNAMKLLRTGCLQLLPVRDNTGRRVFVVIGFKKPKSYSASDRIQLYLYFQTVLSEDIENQKKGVVSLSLPGEHGIHTKELPNRQDRLKLARYILANPVRFCAIHFCYPDTHFFRLSRAAYSLAMHTSESIRFRTKFHMGTGTETRYQLMTYGIPQSQLPLTSGERVKPGSILQWINARALIEGKRREYGVTNVEDCDINIIDCPGFNDVAMRPGKAYLCHPGNVRFKELLDEKIDAYTNGNRKDKDRISWEIISVVKGWNGHFLEWDNSLGFWVENKDGENIRTKIPVYLRDHKRNIRSKQRVQKKRTFTPDDVGSMSPVIMYDKKRKMENENFECNFQCMLQTVFDE
jgi:hypothetical protein